MNGDRKVESEYTRGHQSYGRRKMRMDVPATSPCGRITSHHRLKKINQMKKKGPYVVSAQFDGQQQSRSIAAGIPQSGYGLGPQKMHSERKDQEGALPFAAFDRRHLLVGPIGAAYRNHLDVEAQGPQCDDFPEYKGVIRRRVPAD